MPINKKGGKNHRKSKNSNPETKRELVFKSDNEAYGQILKSLGNSRFKVLCDDEKERIAHLRGSMLRKVWVQIGDIVLLGLRSNIQTQDDKCDILHRYTPDEARNLKAYKELGKIFKLGDINEDEDEDDDIFKEGSGSNNVIENISDDESSNKSDIK